MGQTCSWKSGGMLKSPLMAGFSLRSLGGHGVSREKACKMAVKKSHNSARARPSPRQTRLPGGERTESAVVTSGPIDTGSRQRPLGAGKCSPTGAHTTGQSAPSNLSLKPGRYLRSTAGRLRVFSTDHRRPESGLDGTLLGSGKL